MSARLAPAAEHRYVAERFAQIMAGVPAEAWARRSPVDGWTARDVVAHLIDWLPGLLSSGSGIELPEVVPVDEDPAAAWSARTAAVQDLVEHPGDRQVSNPHIGEVPLADAIDRFYTGDVFFHTWDLARALGVEPALDEARCAEILSGMEPLDEVLRIGGQYGPRVDVPTEASAQDRLMGFIGRDPGWRP